MKILEQLWLVTVLISATALSACGGGGGGSTAPVNNATSEIQMSVPDCTITTPSDTSGSGCRTTITWTGGQVATQVDVKVSDPTLVTSLPTILTQHYGKLSGIGVTIPRAWIYQVEAYFPGSSVTKTFVSSCSSALARVEGGCYLKELPAPSTTNEVAVFYDGSKMFAASDTTSAQQVYDLAGKTPYDYSLIVQGLRSTCFASSINLKGGYPLIKCGPEYSFFDIDTNQFKRWGGAIPASATFLNVRKGTADLMTHTETFTLDYTYTSKGIKSTSIYWMTSESACCGVGSIDPNTFQVIPSSVYRRVSGVNTLVYNSNPVVLSGGGYNVRSIDWMISSKGAAAP